VLHGVALVLQLIACKHTNMTKGKQTCVEKRLSWDCAWN